MDVGAPGIRMQAITILCDAADIRIEFIDGIEVVQNLRLKGRLFHLLGSAWFFDWLLKVDGSPIGVEFHSDDPRLIRSLGSRVSNKGNGFPQLWFTEDQNGEPGHYQDWEDYYLTDDAGRMLFVLDVHSLTQSQVDKVRELLTRK